MELKYKFKIIKTLLDDQQTSFLFSVNRRISSSGASGCFTLVLELKKHALDLPPEKAMAPHSSTLAWRIPVTGEPGGLLSMGSHGVGHD